MLRKEIDTVILDVDGTLSEEVSWLKLTEGLGGSREVHQKIFDDMRSGLLTYPEAKAKLIALWQATGNANKEFMAKMFRSWRLKDDAEEVVNYLSQTYKLCLISGAVDLYVKIVAEKLEVADWFANTELIWDGDGNLVDFHYYQDQAQKKLEQFREFVKREGLNKDRCAVVGDGDSDLALFRELKYGIEVNEESHPELQKLAFKSVKNLTDLRDIL